MAAIITNNTNRTKLFEGLIIPHPPDGELSPKIQMYLRDLNDYIVRLAAGVGQIVGGIIDSEDGDELVKVSSNDTNARYLEQKVTSVDGSVIITTLNDGADEDLDLSTGSPILKYNEWIKFTQTSAKFDVDTRDWRGRILRITGAQFTSNVTVANNTEWAAGSSIMTKKVGSTYDNSGAPGDVDLLQVSGVGANDATISIDEDTGHLQVRCDFWDFEWQVEFLVEGFKTRSVPDRTI